MRTETKQTKRKERKTEARNRWMENGGEYEKREMMTFGYIKRLPLKAFGRCLSRSALK